MFTFRSIVLWIHVAGIIVWVGGMIAIPFVVVPAVRRTVPDRADELIEALVRRFQRLSRELVFLILLTGIFNILNSGAAVGFNYTGRFIQMVGAKLVLFIVMGANQLWYSLVLVPRRKTRHAAWSAAGNVLLAAVVLFLGLTLRYG